MGASQLYLRVSETGAKAQNVAWLTNDYVPDVDAGKAMRFILQIAVSVTAAVVEITLDGTNFKALNKGVALNIGQLYQFDVFAKNGDAFNVRASNTGGTTVDIFYLVADLNA